MPPCAFSHFATVEKERPRRQKRPSGPNELPPSSDRWRKSLLSPHKHIFALCNSLQDALPPYSEARRGSAVDGPPKWRAFIPRTDFPARSQAWKERAGKSFAIPGSRPFGLRGFGLNSWISFERPASPRPLDRAFGLGSVSARVMHHTSASTQVSRASARRSNA